MTAPPSPDPTAGVFETLLVIDGRPVELGAHMERIKASVEALYGARLPAGAEDLVWERAVGLRLGRVRLTAAPSADGMACEAVAVGVDPAIVFPSWKRSAELSGVPFAGGLGCHKWADRSALPETAGAKAPLLLDAGGEVLEAGWASVFAVREGALVTPALDGRILPGIARAATIDVAREQGTEVQERRIECDELLAADEVFLTGSVRGVEPVRSLDGATLPRPGELSRQLSAGLRRRWLNAPVGAAAPAPAAAPPPDPLAR